MYLIVDSVNLFDVFLHEFSMKIAPEGVVDEIFALLLRFSSSTIFKYYIIIPSTFNFKVGFTTTSQ